MSSAKTLWPFKIDNKLCKKCGICVEFCPVGVFSFNKDNSPLISYPEKCIDCKLCSLRCPDFAISRRKQDETNICTG